MTRPTPRAAPYHLLSADAKRAHARDALHEPPVRCICGVQLMPADLLAHVRDPARCSGRPPVHPRSTWISWTEAERTGLEKPTLARLIQHGHVRTRGLRGHREYLLADVAREAARLELTRRDTGPGPRRVRFFRSRPGGTGERSRIDKPVDRRGPNRLTG